MEIITRKDAIRENRKAYFTGKPCKHGHISERLSSSGTCIKCRSAKASNYRRTYYEKKRPEIIAKNKEYTAKNKEAISQYQKKYAAENRESLREYRKSYYNNNPEKFKTNRIRYEKSRKDDTDYRIKKVMRQMVSRTIKGSAGERTKNILGYDHKDLISHIESLFLDGMSWDNYGEWHIDHKTSIKSFLVQGIKDPKTINALSNLQPLWAVDNLKKGA